MLQRTTLLTSGKTMTENLVTTITLAGIQTSPPRQLQPAALRDMAKERKHESVSLRHVSLGGLYCCVLIDSVEDRRSWCFRLDIRAMNGFSESWCWQELYVHPNMDLLTFTFGLLDSEWCSSCRALFSLSQPLSFTLRKHISPEHLLTSSLTKCYTCCMTRSPKKGNPVHGIFDQGVGSWNGW